MYLWMWQQTIAEHRLPGVEVLWKDDCCFVLEVKVTVWVCVSSIRRMCNHPSISVRLLVYPLRRSHVSHLVKLNTNFITLVQSFSAVCDPISLRSVWCNVSTSFSSPPYPAHSAFIFTIASVLALGRPVLALITSGTLFCFDCKRFQLT